MNGFEFIEAKAAEARRRLSLALPELRESRKVFLPGFHEKYRAMPNPLARSSIFSSVARGKKERFEGVLLASRSDAIIIFTGEQLDESQADLWMQLVYEARACALGHVISRP